MWVFGEKQSCIWDNLKEHIRAFGKLPFVSIFAFICSKILDQKIVALVYFYW